MIHLCRLNGFSVFIWDNIRISSGNTKRTNGKILCHWRSAPFQIKVRNADANAQIIGLNQINRNKKITTGICLSLFFWLSLLDLNQRCKLVCIKRLNRKYQLITTLRNDKSSRTATRQSISCPLVCHSVIRLPYSATVGGRLLPRLKSARVDVQT